METRLHPPESAFPFRSALPRVIILILCLMVMGPAPGCSEAPPRDTFQGYAEAEFTFLSSPLGGHLRLLAVKRGDQVQAGRLIFRLDDGAEKAAHEEAGYLLKQARDQLANLGKGARPSEIQAIRARLTQAQTRLKLSKLDYERKKTLYRQKSIPKSEFDSALTGFHSDEAGVVQIKAELETAQLGARSDEIAAAKAAVEAAGARLALTQWNLEQKSQSSPGAGRVFDTFFTLGEWVASGRPVAALIVPENLKVRFFVPEPRISGFKLGQTLGLSCDGCPPGMRARISYISPQAEYTPPVIYSQETRGKLVFMLEAKPDRAGEAYLHPGQPMEVKIIPGGTD